MIIEIIKTPQGEAPEEIRRAWIGLRFPLIAVLEDGKTDFGVIAGQQDENSGVLVAAVFRLRSISTGVLTGKLVTAKKKVFLVRQSVSLTVLKERNPDAARWWENNEFPKSLIHNFGFGFDEAMVVKNQG